MSYHNKQFHKMMESTQAKRVKLTMLNFNYIRVIIINMNIILLTDISSTSYYIIIMDSSSSC